VDLSGTSVATAIASRALESPLSLPQRPLPSEIWIELLDVVDHERLWGEVAHALEAGALPATDDQARVAHERHAQAMALAVELEATAVEVVRALRERQIEVRILKGMATAHLDHPEPARRSFGDIDLLSPPGRFADTIDALERLGWQRDLPERARGFDERFGKDGTLTRGGIAVVDLHRTLALGPFGLWIDLEALWEGSEELVLAGVPLQALDRPRRLLHACYAAVLGDPMPRLSTLQEVALLMELDPSAGKAGRELASSWHGRIVVDTALAMAAARFGRPSSGTVDTRARPSTVERLALRSYRSQGGSNTALRLAGVLAIPRWRRRLSYLRATALPSRSYRRARLQASRPREWSTGLKELVRRDSRSSDQPPPEGQATKV
jgi:hypothetical protein